MGEKRTEQTHNSNEQSSATATPPAQDIRTELIKDPATRIALITGLVSVLITLLNALLG